ncbi:MAG: hypothetical protein WD058_06405 [Dehalococcoidia bacterium]
MTKFTPVDGDVVEDARTRIAEFAANDAVLDREWARLLADHRDEWVAVFGRGALVTAATMADILEAVPEDERDTAVIQFLGDTDRVLVW